MGFWLHHIMTRRQIMWKTKTDTITWPPNNKTTQSSASLPRSAVDTGKYQHRGIKPERWWITSWEWDSKCARPKSGENLEKGRINKEKFSDIEKYRNMEKNEWKHGFHLSVLNQWPVILSYLSMVHLFNHSICCLSLSLCPHTQTKLSHMFS